MRPDFLAGLRVVDLTWAGAGPFATKVFSDFGAEVIKVESTTRADPVRLGAPFKDGVAGLNRSGYFASRNTRKKSISLNLKIAEAQEAVRELIRHADVISNNFGPGAMDRLGLSYDEVRAIKPDIIYLAMPMYGETGPLSGLLGVGMTISAVTGFTSLTGYSDGPPLGPGTHYPDHAANPYHAAFAVLAALRLRRRTGRGMKIDLSQVESTLNFLGIPLTGAAISGKAATRNGNRSEVHAPYNVFRCRGDDEWCAIAVTSDKQWNDLTSILGRSDLGEDENLKRASGRLHRIDDVESAVASWTLRRTSSEVVTELQRAGIAAGMVQHSRTLIEDDPQLRSRGYWQHLDHPEIGQVTLNSPPYLMDGERVELVRPPLIGEHTDELLANVAGYSAERIQRLRELGAIEDPPVV